LLAPQEVRDFLRFWSKDNGKSNESDRYKQLMLMVVVGNKRTRAKQNCGIWSVNPNVVQKDALMLRHLNKNLHFRFFISAHQIKKKHAHTQFFFSSQNSSEFSCFLFFVVARSGRQAIVKTSKPEHDKTCGDDGRRDKSGSRARERAHRNKLVVCVDLH
jgi:hypothetical protein